MANNVTGTDMIYNVQPEFAAAGLNTTAFSEELGALDAPRYIAAGCTIGYYPRVPNPKPVASTIDRERLT